MQVAEKHHIFFLLFVFTAICLGSFSVTIFALDDGGEIEKFVAPEGNIPGTGSGASQNENENICANCGKKFPSSADICPACGWPSVNFYQAYNISFEPGFEILEVNTRSVDVTFTGITILEGGNSEKPDAKYWQVQLKWGTDKIINIPLNTIYHGYLIRKVEISDANETQNWRLTIEQMDGKIINLEANSATTVTETYVRLTTDSNNKESGTLELYEGNTFETKGRIYKIKNITDQRVLINDIAGFAFIIKMSR